MTPAERRAALEREFDRLAERQDRIHATLSGDPAAWLGVQQRMGSEVAEVTLDKAVAEGRQGALAMASILKTLDGTAPAEAPATPGGDMTDEVSAWRAAKLAEAQQREAARGLADAH